MFGGSSIWNRVINNNNLGKMFSKNVTASKALKGSDSNGNQYNSVKHALESIESKNKTKKDGMGWYNGSVDYWNKQAATNNGVLGGYGNVHAVDIDTSGILLD
jgi:hypothetical protein